MESPLLVPHHGLDAPSRGWAERVTPTGAAGTDKNTPTEEKTAQIPLQSLVSSLVAEEEKCPRVQPAPHQAAYQLAHTLIHEAVRDMLPASAMLYVPPSDLVPVVAKLQQAVQTMVADAYKTATAYGKDLCPETLSRELKRQLKHHLKHDRSAQNLLMRHSPAHMLPNHCIAPETGMHTVAAIHARYGGVDLHHGSYHGSCHP